MQLQAHLNSETSEEGKKKYQELKEKLGNLEPNNLNFDLFDLQE